MAWQSPSSMGVGNGGGNGAEGGNQANQPQGTEYTLQGVMRFLQTEWHRHERERNAWEIERQEMKARIASLEGSGRRSDAQQASLKKYIKMLENVVAQERRKAKGLDTKSDPIKNGKEKHTSKKEEHRPANDKPHNSFLDVKDAGDEDLEKPDKANLLSYLNQCNGEFTYLMVSPSNPQPPQEPPQQLLSFEEDQRQPAPPSRQAIEEIYLQEALQKNQREMARQSQLPNHQAPPDSAPLPIRNHPDSQAGAMIRSNPEPQNSNQPSQGEWSEPFALPEQTEEEAVTQVNHSFDSYGRPTESTEGQSEREGGTEADGWDFNETAAYPDPEPKPSPSRPDTDLFPVAQDLPTSPSRGAHRRKTSVSRRRSADKEITGVLAQQKADGSFKVRFGLRGHLDAVRTVIFTGGGSPGEPEICTAGDDGVIKRWYIPVGYEHGGMHTGGSTDLDIQSKFTHRGHTGAVMCLAAYSPSANFASGGRAQGDGWVFSGGQDASIRVWERGRVDPKATLDGHTDAVWTICVLPANCGAVFGQNSAYGGSDRILIASGAADGMVKVWSVSAPPTLMSPQGSTGRRGGRVRGNSMSSGSAFPSSPQPSMASNSPFTYTLIHTLRRSNSDASPTCITPLSPSGDNFVVSYSDAAVLVYDTRTGEELAAMASLETYDGTMATGVNAIVAKSTGFDGSTGFDLNRGLPEDDAVVHGATGSSGGIEGIIISGHEDRYIRFYDANSGE
ncbi:MAG: hypothetical protein M1818_003919 [Claussenomyces sp. TS43310]|nr:MAG: hypothetical protein M1818_003919 [Claussenomyces sp. TS43310]